MVWVCTGREEGRRRSEAKGHTGLHVCVEVEEAGPAAAVLCHEAVGGVRLAVCRSAAVVEKGGHVRGGSETLGAIRGSELLRRVGISL